MAPLQQGAGRLAFRYEGAMIKDVMVRLDGTSEDDVRLVAAGQIAEIFESPITGLFFNVLPPPLIEHRLNGTDASQTTKLLDSARQTGDAIEATVFERLTQLQQPTNLRRFDVVGVGEISDTALPLARAADTFVALRPIGRSNEPEGLIENLLFGKRTHLRAMTPCFTSGITASMR
jgi:hypothetical protein